MEVKTNLITCPQGHYYNAAVHSSCPICGGAGSVPPTEGSPSAGTPGFPTTVPFSETGPIRGGGTGFVKTEKVVQREVFPGGVDMPGFTIIGGDEAAPDGQSEPVVGWLVCVEGPVRGTDYRIHAGYNYIGRELGDIHIPGDQQISRQNHAMIAYDSSERLFYVGPSAGRNLIKVNGKTVLNAVEIKSYDIISIGTTKMMFVALCGEQFSWEKGLNHG